MFTAKYYSASGDAEGTRELPPSLFDGEVNGAVLHQVTKALLANRRQGNAATKTRGMVAGGGRKIWRQKGTGRARQGSIRAPHWRGGGTVFGPSPRSYTQKVPRKVRLLARRSAFNLQARRERLSIIAGFDFDAPKTRQMAELLDRLEFTDRRVLILTDGSNGNVRLSARNIPDVEVMPFDQVSAYDLVRARAVLIEEAALDAAVARLGVEETNG